MNWSTLRLLDVVRRLRELAWPKKPKLPHHYISLHALVSEVLDFGPATGQITIHPDALSPHQTADRASSGPATGRSPGSTGCSAGRSANSCNRAGHGLRSAHCLDGGLLHRCSHSLLRGNGHRFLLRGSSRFGGHVIVDRVRIASPRLGNGCRSFTFVFAYGHIVGALVAQLAKYDVCQTNICARLVAQVGHAACRWR